MLAGEMSEGQRGRTANQSLQDRLKTSRNHHPKRHCTLVCQCCEARISTLYGVLRC